MMQCVCLCLMEEILGFADGRWRRYSSRKIISHGLVSMKMGRLINVYNPFFAQRASFSSWWLQGPGIAAPVNVEIPTIDQG